MWTQITAEKHDSSTRGPADRWLDLGVSPVQPWNDEADGATQKGAGDYIGGEVLSSLYTPDGCEAGHTH